MVGNVILPLEGIYVAPDPKNYFDPTTHIATEADFIRLLEAGIYSDEIIGYKVQLGNTVDYNNGLQVIADVDHDSTNTGQTNCYDLISVDAFYLTTYGSSGNYRDSTIRTWLNNNFYNGFNNNFKARIINPKYNFYYTQYNDDKIILLSGTEVGASYSGMVSEGTKYPIFANSSITTLDSTKVKYNNNVACDQQLRSLYTSNSNYTWAVYNSGRYGYNLYYSQYNIAPVLRVQ